MGRVFRSEILPELPVGELSKHYHETDARPTNEMYSMVGLMILQQMHDLNNEEAIEQFTFNIKWHYALNITGNSDKVSFVSDVILLYWKYLGCQRAFFVTYQKNNRGRQTSY